MTMPAFAQSDFDVFTIPGLEPRMNALIERVRPKLTALGEQLAAPLSTLCGEEMFPHVAKHARRTINPPNDSWVAWANNKRGYKAYPHFQIGLFAGHLFIQFAIIYESPNKLVFADRLQRKLGPTLKQLPGDYFWSTDHMKPDVTFQREMKKADFAQLANQLKQVKKAEVMCGLQLLPDDPRLADGAALQQLALATFERLLPLYRQAW